MTEPGAGFEPAGIGFADRRVSHFTIRAYGGNGKIRTFDSRKGSASLAGRWFNPLTHASIV